MESFEHAVGPVTLYVEYDHSGEFSLRLTEDGPDVYDIGLLSTAVETEVFEAVNRRCK